MIKCSIVSHLARLCLLIIALPATLYPAELKIIVGGAQSLAPLAEKFSSQFSKNRPGVEIEVRPVNSNYAVTAVRAGDIHIGLVARSLSAVEKAVFHVEALGHDAIILLSYPWNSATDITLDQLRRVYLGQITNWKEIGGEDQGIVPLTREQTSALHGVFIERLFGKGFRRHEKAFILRANKDKVLRTIKRIRGSLGYGIVRVEEAQSEGIKVLAVNGVAPTTENIREQTYPFVRPQFVIAKGKPDGLVREWMVEFVKFAQRSAPREEP